MNYLAHFHLAWPEPALVAGALEGDYAKGALPGCCRPELEAGVRLHRFIDAHTDSHPLLADCRRQFPLALRRYAGILMDLSFDYYLSVHWQQFESSLPRHVFCAQTYEHLERFNHHFSPGAQRMHQRLRDYDILGAYIDWRAVPGSAARIGQRLRRHNPLGDVDAALAPLRPLLEQTFLAYYPVLQQAVAEKRQSLGENDKGCGQKPAQA